MHARNRRVLLAVNRSRPIIRASAGASSAEPDER
jgi:hypothetical protein